MLPPLLSLALGCGEAPTLVATAPLKADGEVPYSKFTVQSLL